MIGGWMQSRAWPAGNTDFRWDQRLLSADVCDSESDVSPGLGCSTQLFRHTPV